MKKNKILILISIFIIALIFLINFSFPVFAADIVNSPSLKCSSYSSLIKNDDIAGTISDCNDHQDVTLTTGPVFDIDASLKNEKMFFIAKDAAKNKELTKQFIYDKDDLGPATCIIPYYSDKIHLDFYKQNRDDPDFTTRERNLIDSAELNLAKDLVYRRGQETALTPLDENGNITTNGEHFFFSRVTPNYYSIRIERSSYTTHAEIVLPEDQANLLTDEEKTIDPTYYRPPTIPTETEQPNAVRQEGYYYNFRLPEKVTDFKFVVHAISETSQYFSYQCNIHLNKN